MEQNRSVHSEFHTLKGYQLKKQFGITESMEDYLEMICRYCQKNDYMRINLLASKLNVQPSSSSKMVSKLKQLGLVNFERYGLITPTQKGWEIGSYLLWRHDVLLRFFCKLNHSENELQQVEQIEHFITRETVENLEKLLGRL